MKVLWFTNTPVDYDESTSGYNGGGWMSALKDEVIKTTDIQLGISFYGRPSDKEKIINSVTYYPILFGRDVVSKLRRTLSKSEQENDHVEEYKKIISDFKPDVIHIFGTENPFGLISKFTDVPTVVHLQGLINPCLNALLPPSYSKLDFLKDKGTSPWNVVKNINSYLGWKEAAVREKKIFQETKNFMGRTHWDKSICKILAPDASYFHCNEILRPEFNLCRKNTKRCMSKKVRIVSTISNSHYKGADIILKTAKILKDIMKLDFEWSVFGVMDIDYASSKLDIDVFSNNISIKGIVSALELATSLSEATVYVHPSYIDNSPNSICEAQVIGIPVVANDVGGVSSLISHKKTGFLVPANDPFMLAHYIQELGENLDIRDEIISNAQSISIKRHNPSIIIDDLFKIYKTILN